MRGCQEPQVPMLTFVDMDGRVPPDHPLRTIKALADEALRELSSEFDRMYAEVGRPSIPPERLLKASLLIALFSVRSERAFCEELDYNMLYRWFLDMNLLESSLTRRCSPRTGSGCWSTQWGNSCLPRSWWGPTGTAYSRTSTSPWTGR